MGSPPSAVRVMLRSTLGEAVFTEMRTRENMCWRVTDEYVVLLPHMGTAAGSNPPGTYTCVSGKTTRSDSPLTGYSRL